MTTKHTPGPWVIGEEIPCRIDNSKGEIICAVLYSTTPGEITPETQANAKLIAAAPELLECVQLMYMELYGGNSINIEDAMRRSSKNDEFEQRIVAIIKKATQ